MIFQPDKLSAFVLVFHFCILMFISDRRYLDLYFLYLLFSIVNFFLRFTICITLPFDLIFDQLWLLLSHLVVIQCVFESPGLKLCIIESCFETISLLRCSLSLSLNHLESPSQTLNVVRICLDLITQPFIQNINGRRHWQIIIKGWSGVSILNSWSSRRNIVVPWILRWFWSRFWGA